MLAMANAITHAQSIIVGKVLNTQSNLVGTHLKILIIKNMNIMKN
jgi:hypothetical protein